MKHGANLTWRAVLGFVRLFVLASLILGQGGEEKTSRPGKYKGYSQPIYDEWVRTSQYVAVQDGTELAVDIFRPARGGEPASEPLPVVWSHNRYHRADAPGGQLSTILDSEPWLKTLLRHAYAVAVVDVRGSGASYGTRSGSYSLQDAQDAYDITEWLAAQPWCDGNVGMYGASFMGGAQMMATSLAPPHLKAIVPQVAPFDRYFEYYPGGVFAEEAAAAWSRTVRELDTVLPAAPVDRDNDGAMLAEAMAEHQANEDFYRVAASLPYRDSLADENKQLWLAWGASNYLAEISRSGIPIYHMAGWYDYYRRGALVAFNALDNPQKVLVGPWTHHRYGEHFDLGAEHLRWYDYWLKGIDNGIMDEAPIYYYTLGLPEKEAWRSASKWPLPNEQPTRYYFRAGPSRSVRSANDGLLDTHRPTASTGQDDYLVDYTTTRSEGINWNDRRGLTYTSAPLAQDVEVTGHSILHLWVTSSAGDGDFFVSLEEVSEKGVSTYVTEGILRASHRALAESPFLNGAPFEAYEAMGLPYHRGFAEDVADLPEGEPVELVLDLLPTSNVFDAGHRIRVTITCADKGNMRTPVLSPPPTVSVYRNANYASHIILPIIPIGSDEAAIPAESAEGSTRVVLLSVAIVLVALAGVTAIAVIFVKKS